MRASEADVQLGRVVRGPGLRPEWPRLIARVIAARDDVAVECVGESCRLYERICTHVNQYAHEYPATHKDTDTRPRMHTGPCRHMLHARINTRAHTRGAVDLVGDIIGEQCIVADQRVEYGAELAAIELLRRCPHLRVFENEQLVLTPVPPRLLGPVAFYPLSRTFCAMLGIVSSFVHSDCSCTRRASFRHPRNTSYASRASVTDDALQIIKKRHLLDKLGRCTIRRAIAPRPLLHDDAHSRKHL